MKANIDTVIGMAWSDKISFEEIKKKTGLKESEVILRLIAKAIATI